MDQLEDIDRAHLAVMTVNQNQRYRIDWEHIVQKNLQYKRPYLINGTFFERLNDDTDVLDENETNWKAIQDISDTDEETPMPVLKAKRLKKEQPFVLEMQEDGTMKQLKKDPLPQP